MGGYQCVSCMHKWPVGVQYERLGDGGWGWTGYACVCQCPLSVSKWQLVNERLGSHGCVSEDALPGCDQGRLRSMVRKQQAYPQPKFLCHSVEVGIVSLLVGDTVSLYNLGWSEAGYINQTGLTLLELLLAPPPKRWD